MKASATNGKVEYSINGRVLEYRTVEEEAQVVQEERNNVVRSDRLRLHKIENELRVAGIRSGNKELSQIANAIDNARYWESFQDSYSDDQVAVAQELHIASRGTDSSTFAESVMPVLLKVMVLQDLDGLRRSK
tara:strand:- start:353 stop:751 length:399 start_codon:yes stop_codon:yes gene_type:complete